MKPNNIEDILKELDSESYVQHLGYNQSWTGTPVKVVELNKARQFILTAIKQAFEAVELEEKRIDKRFSTDERRYPHGYNQAVKDQKDRMKKFMGKEE